MRKNERGITLVALVVTIVVMLILAAVSINMAFGNNGIFTTVKQAKEMNDEAAAKEKRSIDSWAKLMGWDLSIVYGKEDTDGYLMPIPNGYYYVEGTKNTGFVISDSQIDENNPNSADGNQYVWVPVDDINEYKLISWNGEKVAEKQAADTYYSEFYDVIEAGEGGGIRDTEMMSLFDLSLLENMERREGSGKTDSRYIF